MLINFKFKEIKQKIGRKIKRSHFAFEHSEHIHLLSKEDLNCICFLTADDFLTRKVCANKT